MSKHKFQTEINQLLQLMIHSLYSNKDIFLRELISNSSDALDKLQYLTMTDDVYKNMQFNPKIEISFDKEKKTLTISDTGVGMNGEELTENLGTIAKSGTKSFLEKLSGDAKKDSNLIGQFGVGFYASFMVANKVEVLSKKAGEEKAYSWISSGDGEYDIEEAHKDGCGTTITLHLKDDADEYTSEYKIESIVKRYSDHIAFPIYLAKKENNDQINKASALWRRGKSEISEDEYNEFYSHISHDSDTPLLRLHTKAEGALEYTTLFFVPKKAPFDMWRVDYRPGVRLYVKRVFITDEDKELLPTYLRFVKGVIDCEDLPLNVSREILQQNKVLANVKSASTKKVLSELNKLSKADKEAYEGFYAEFGRALKEGVYQDYTNKESLLELLRFKSSTREGKVSLDEYITEMKAEQKAIYYITGENETLLRNSPLLESFKAKNIEVLLLDEDIDEIVIPSVDKYKEHELKSVNRGEIEEVAKSEVEKDVQTKLEPLVERMKKYFGDEVKEVRLSARLSESASCIVADKDDPTVQMQHILRSLGQAAPEAKPILEVNPSHAIVAKMSLIPDEQNELFGDYARLLLEEAMLLGGMQLKDASAFAKRINRLLGA